MNYLGGGDEADNDAEFFLLNCPKKLIPPEMRFDIPTFKLCIALLSSSKFALPIWDLLMLELFTFLLARADDCD